MVQVFDDPWQNRPKKFQDNELTSLKLHQRYKSLPNMPKQLISEGEVVQIDLQSSTAFMIQVFKDLRENRQMAVDISDIKSSKAQRLCKSMPDLVFLTNAPDAMLSTEITGNLPDSPYAETTISAVMTLVTTELIDIDTMLSVSPTFSLVKPVESDAQ